MTKSISHAEGMSIRAYLSLHPPHCQFGKSHTLVTHEYQRCLCCEKSKLRHIRLLNTAFSIVQYPRRPPGCLIILIFARLFCKALFFLFHDVCILGAVCYCFLFCHYSQDIQYGVIKSEWNEFLFYHTKLRIFSRVHATL